MIEQNDATYTYLMYDDGSLWRLNGSKTYTEPKYIMTDKSIKSITSNGRYTFILNFNSIIGLIDDDIITIDSNDVENDARNIYKIYCGRILLILFNNGKLYGFDYKAHIRSKDEHIKLSKHMMYLYDNIRDIYTKNKLMILVENSNNIDNIIKPIKLYRMTFFLCKSSNINKILICSNNPFIICTDDNYKSRLIHYQIRKYPPYTVDIDVIVENLDHVNCCSDGFNIYYKKIEDNNWQKYNLKSKSHKISEYTNNYIKKISSQGYYFDLTVPNVIIVSDKYRNILYNIPTTNDKKIILFGYDFIKKRFDISNFLHYHISIKQQIITFIRSLYIFRQRYEIIFPKYILFDIISNII